MPRVVGWVGAIAITLAVFSIWEWQDQQSRIKAEEKAEREARNLETQRAQQVALLGDPKAVETEIEGRLEAWVSRAGQYIVLRTRASSGEERVSRTLPRERRWSVTCNRGILRVAFDGDGPEDDDGALERRLLPGTLTVEQCTRYLPLADELMREALVPR